MNKKKLGTEDETNSGMEMNFGLCSLQAELTALLGMGGRPTAVGFSMRASSRGMAPERYLRRDMNLVPIYSLRTLYWSRTENSFPKCPPPNTSMETPAEDTLLQLCTSSSWCEWLFLSLLPIPPALSSPSSVYFELLFLKKSNCPWNLLFVFVSPQVIFE